jgi:hypothetical protein
MHWITRTGSLPINTGVNPTMSCPGSEDAYSGGFWIEGNLSDAIVSQSAPGGNLSNWHFSIENADLLNGITYHLYVLCGPGVLTSALAV